MFAKGLENWVTWLKPRARVRARTHSGFSGPVIVGQFSSRKRHLPLFVVVFKSLPTPNAREILKYKWKTKSVGKKIHFRSKSFSIVLVQGKHHSIIFQSNYICTKNLKYWTRMIPGDSRRLVQLNTSLLSIWDVGNFARYRFQCCPCEMAFGIPRNS